MKRLLGVVARNRDYRRLFTAGAVSQVGDWFNVVALFSLLLKLTGKGEAVAGVFVLRSLCIFVMGPIAGVLADRISRRTIMVVADGVRAVAVLGYLLVHDLGQVWLAYVLVAIHALASAFFDPAQLAAYPNLVPKEDLLLASALENSLWSFALALGSALAGVVMVTLGRDAAFVGDALTFVFSAALLSRLPALRAKPLEEGELLEGNPELPPARPTGGFLSGRRGRLAKALGLQDVLDGARYVLGHRRIRTLLLVKAAFGLTLGGILVLLTVFGERVLGRQSGGGIAALWTARGVGSFLGPLVAWRLGGDSEPALRRGITYAYLAIFFMYLALAPAPSLWIAVPVLAIANAGGSILWTYGASLQQLLVPDAFRGRVFAADNSGLTLTMCISTLVVGVALDHGYSPRVLMTGCALVTVFPIVYWISRQKDFAPSRRP